MTATNGTTRRRKEGGDNQIKEDNENEGNNGDKSPTSAGSNGAIVTEDRSNGSVEEEETWPEGATRIVRNLAMYRFILFSILVYDWTTYLPHAAWPGRYDGMDTWFTYDQFEFFYHLAPKMNDPVWGEAASRMLYLTGIIAGSIAAVGGIPGVAYSFELFGIIMVSLYAFRFLTFVQFFTNHNYLFMLLGVLVVVSGGGSYHRPTFTTSATAELTTSDNGDNKNQDQQQKEETERRMNRIIQKSEWGAIMIRIQYAIIYLYASVWKMTTDWVDGSICKAIFLTFEEQGVNRGVPWGMLYGEFGDPLFKLVALGGLILDSAMFVALFWRKPNYKTTKLFTTLSIMFHGFVCFTMSQRIGYTFPSCCLAGSLIFQPIGNDPDEDEEDNDLNYSKSKKDDDYNNNNNNNPRNKNGSPNNNNSSKTKAKKKSTTATVVTAQIVGIQDDEGNLLQWIQRYVMGTKAARATPAQRYFALAWTLWQVAMPARMPIISQNTFPFTARCYRFSWTMMLHARASFILHTGKHPNPDGTLSQTPFFLPFDMINLYPECADIVPIQRNMYQPASVYRHADPRTLPLISENHGLIQMRQRALIDQFPRHIARVGGGWSEHFFKKLPQACKNTNTGENRPLSVYGVVYYKLNGKGAYCRMFDPTVNLAKSERARKRRSFWETIRGVILDVAPTGHEYLLIKGVGSLNSKAEEHKRQLAKYYPEAKRIELIADRAACLAARPLALWPSGFPLAVLALELPYNVELRLSRRTLPDNTPPEKQWDGLSEPTYTTLGLKQLEMTGSDTTVMELRTRTTTTSLDLGNCGDTTEEDVLFALLFMQ